MEISSLYQNKVLPIIMRNNLSITFIMPLEHIFIVVSVLENRSIYDHYICHGSLSNVHGLDSRNSCVFDAKTT